MTADQIIDGIMQREGEGKPPWLVPGDAGGRTRWGISERAHTEAWKNGPPDDAACRAIYVTQYVAPWDFIIEAGYDDRLRVQLIDFGVNSGRAEAMVCLDRVLDLVADSEGLSVATIPVHLSIGHDRHANNELLAERFVFLHTLSQRPGQQKFWAGWATRCASFYWGPDV